MPNNETTISTSFVRLVEIMHRLRQPNGCPWDQQQTAQSLTPYILEEACEVIEAIEHGTESEVCEELGDLLLQVIFQAEIYNELNQFSISDVCNGITDKLRRRHPHVFDESNACDENNLDQQWERIKLQEKGKKQRESILEDIPLMLPALTRSTKVIKRAIKSGHQPPETSPSTSAHDEESLGQNLLSLCSQAVHLKIDPEAALRKAMHQWVQKNCEPP